MGSGKSEIQESFKSNVFDNKQDITSTNLSEADEINTNVLGESIIQNNTNDNIILNDEREQNELQTKKEIKLEKIKSTDIALQMNGINLQTQIEENKNVSKGIKKVNDNMSKRQELIDHKRKVFGNKYVNKDDSKEMKRIKKSLKALNTAVAKEREDKEPLLHYTKVIEDAYLDAISECQHYVSVKSTWLGDTRYNMVLNVMKSLTEELSLVSSFKLAQVELTDEEKESVKNGSQILAAATVFRYLGESNRDKKIAAKKKEFYNGKKYDAKAEDEIIQDPNKSAENIKGVLSDMEALPAAIASLIMGMEKPTEFCEKFGEDGRDILFGLYKLLNEIPSNSAHCEYINTATFSLDEKRGQRRKFSSDKSHNIMGLMQEKDGTLSLRILVNGDTKLIRLRNDKGGICNSICSDILENEKTFGRELINDRIIEIISKNNSAEKINSYRDEYINIIEKRLGIADMKKYAATLRGVSSEKLRSVLGKVSDYSISTEAEFAVSIGYKPLNNTGVEAEQAQNDNKEAEKIKNTNVNTPEIIEKVEAAKHDTNIEDKVVLDRSAKKVEIKEETGDELIEKEEVDEETLKQIEEEIAAAKENERKNREKEEERRIIFEKQSQWSKEEESIKNLIADLIFSKDSIGVDKINNEKKDDTKKKADRIRKVLYDNVQALVAAARHPKLLARFIKRLPFPMENSIIGEINEQFNELLGGYEDASGVFRNLGDNLLISQIKDKIDSQSDELLAQIEDTFNEKIIDAAQAVQDKVKQFYSGGKDAEDEDAEEEKEEKEEINDLSKYCIKVEVDENTYNGDEYIKKNNTEVEDAESLLELLKKREEGKTDDNSPEVIETEKEKAERKANIKKLSDLLKKKTLITMPEKIETTEEKSQAVRYIIAANTTVNKNNTGNRKINFENILKVIKSEKRLSNDDLCAVLSEHQKQKYGETTINYMCNESMSGDKGQGLFIKKVMNSYFAGVSDMDKRSMFAEAIRNAKPYLRTKETVQKEMEEEKKKQERKANAGFFSFVDKISGVFDDYNGDAECFADKEEFVTEKTEDGVEDVEKEYLSNLSGNFMSGFIKGAGPLLQKVLQGSPVNSDTNVFIRQALQDVRSKLLPISDDVVKAQLLDMVNKSNGSITKIEVVKSLGAASVGEAFLCKMYGPTELSSGKEIVVKILRPDAQSRMMREKEIMLKCARETNAGMEATYKGMLERIMEELNLEIEASNVKAGAIYDNQMVSGKEDNVKSMKLNESIKATSDYMVADKAEGTTVDNYLNELEEKINTLLKPFARFTEDGKTLYRDKDGNIEVSVNNSNNLKFMKTFYAINDLLKDARNRQRYLVNLGEKWAEEGLFKSGFYHGDLHAGNILVSEKEATVIDFGNSTSLSDEVKTIITGMLIYAADSQREGYAEKFVASYGKLMRPESQGVFEEKKNEFTKVVKMIFELGSINETGGRIATVLLRAQELGLELPAPIYNFSMCQIRISNTINDYNKKLKELEKTAKTFAKAQGSINEKERNYGDFVKDARNIMITNVFDEEETGAQGIKDNIKQYALCRAFFRTDLLGDPKTVKECFGKFKSELDNAKRNRDQRENFHKIFKVSNYDMDRMKLLKQCKKPVINFFKPKKLSQEEADYLDNNKYKIFTLFNAAYFEYVNSAKYNAMTDEEKDEVSTYVITAEALGRQPIDKVEDVRYDDVEKLFDFIEKNSNDFTLSKIIKNEVEKYFDSEPNENEEEAAKALYTLFYTVVSRSGGMNDFEAGYEFLKSALDSQDITVINKNMRSYFTGTDFGPLFKSKIAEYYELKANKDLEENAKKDQMKAVKEEIGRLHEKITAIKLENMDSEAKKIDKSLEGFGGSLETFNDGMARAISRHKGDTAKGVGYWESAKIAGREFVSSLFGIDL